LSQAEKKKKQEEEELSLVRRRRFELSLAAMLSLCFDSR